jgi:hypothetical protein
MGDVAKLTDRQIVDIYCHPREEDGSIRREGWSVVPDDDAAARAMALELARELGIEPRKAGEP